MTPQQTQITLPKTIHPPKKGIALADLRVEEKRGPAKRNTWYFRERDGVQVCGSPKAHTDLRCSVAMALGEVNGRCRYHGRDSPGAPMTAHGLYSVLPDRLAPAFEAAALSSELLDMGPRLALMEAILNDQLERINDGDTAELRRSVLALLRQARKELGEDSPEPLEKALLLLTDGIKNDKAIDKVYTMVQKNAREAQRYWDVEHTKTQSIGAVALVAILGRFITIVEEVSGTQNAAKVMDLVKTRLLKT